MFVRLAKFLDLPEDSNWIKNSISVANIKSGYHHDKDLVRFYIDCVEKRKTEFPEISQKLIAIVK